MRQLYYQAVARLLIENAKSEYKKLSTLLGKARLMGLVPWEAIEDRARSRLRSGGWSDAAHFIEDTTRHFLVGYRRDLLQDQDVALELWLEKDALSSLVHRVAFEYCVPVVVAKGFSSLSFLNSCRERVLSNFDEGKQTVLIYFGDLDPSGWAMLPTMMETLQVEMDLRHRVVGRRCALLPEHVEQFDLPHDPLALKWSDTRAKKYVEKFGRVAVELDALSPAALQGLVRESIEAELDMDLFQEQVRIQEEEEQQIEQHRERLLRDIEDDQ